MRETQERVGNALREMVYEMPYRKVTVHELCLRAGVSRNTFYNNFEDKDAVVRFIFEDGVIQPIRDLNRLLSTDDLKPLMERMNEQMYQRLKDDGEFYKDLIVPMGTEEVFLKVATRTIYDLNMELIPKTTVITDDWKLDYASYFYAASQAMLMQKWVSDDFDISARDLAGFYSEMTSTFWRSNAR